MNQSNSILRSEEGLTLLEIMIAIVLLAFVMFGVIAIIDNSQNTKDRTIQLDRDNLQIETAMSRIEWDFSQVWSPLYFTQRFTGNLDPSTNPGVEEVAYLYENHPRFRQPSKEGLPIPKFLLREKNEIIFLTTSNRRKLEDQKQSHFMWVRYYVGESTIEDTTEGAGGVEKTVKSLMRQVFPDDPWAKEELTIDTTRSAVLLENIESLEFLFWNRATRKWESNLATIVDGEALWRGMQVNLTWLDSKGQERKTSRWLRPLWPSTIPQDPASGAAQGGNQGGAAQSGAQAGAQGGVQGGTPAGAQGGGAEEGEE
jgi:type II secretory pathway pseudopilin PulG